MTLEILQRAKIPQSGFAGLREYQMVMNSDIFGSYANEQSWNGIGNFVYLADAKFEPFGETRLHHHKGIDVISVLVEGRISHEGSLGNGKSIKKDQVQVQSSGLEGFSHNEVNPDNFENRMIQLWILPEKKDSKSNYKTIDLEKGKIVRVYGNEENKNNEFSNKTSIDIGILALEQDIEISGRFIAYITRGSGKIDEENISEGDLVQGKDLKFKSTSDRTQIIIIKDSKFKSTSDRTQIIIIKDSKEEKNSV